MKATGDDQGLIQLRRDYETLVLAGAKFTADAAGNPQLDQAQLNALDRLIATGLAVRDNQAFVLRRPSEAHVQVDSDTADFLDTLHTLWLRLDDDLGVGDEILYGELGYWQHWGNTLNDGTDRTITPLRMDMMLPERGGFLNQQWTEKLDPEILNYVFTEGLVDVRVIVPPATHGDAAQAFIEFVLERGVQVRVLPSTVEFSIYGDAVVMPDEQPAGEIERHRLTRRRAVVDPLMHLFELRWASALPWESFIHGSEGILQLLALGWTDARIANATNTSPRTVSRRIAALMDAAGVQSRFELGVKYALHELGPPTREFPDSVASSRQSRHE